MERRRWGLRVIELPCFDLAIGGIGMNMRRRSRG